MDLGLKGKVVLVTGSGSGVGRVIALTFAEEGANVAVNDLAPKTKSFDDWAKSGLSKGKTISELFPKEVQDRYKNLSPAFAVAEECKKLGSKANGFEADVTKFDQVQAMVEKVLKEYGVIDVLVNNAGGAMDIGAPFATMSKEAVEWTTNLCYYGPMFCIKAVLPHMIERKQGRIVNILSDARKGTDRGLAVYGAAKAGIESFTKTIACEVARYGVHVNAVSPAGPNLSERAVQGWKQTEQQIGKEAARERMDKMLKLYLLGPYYKEKFYRGEGSAKDVANMVAFLASERADWVTAQTISVSGGYHV